MADVNHTNSTASVDPAQMALAGTRCVGLTFARAFETPGMPSSRENANNMRETDVTVARPQSHCEMKMTTYIGVRTASGTRSPMAQKNTFQPCLAASSMFGIISTNA